MILLILDLFIHVCETLVIVILFAYCVSAKNTTELIYAGKDFMVMRTEQPTKCLYHISYGG